MLPRVSRRHGVLRAAGVVVAGAKRPTARRFLRGVTAAALLDKSSHDKCSRMPPRAHRRESLMKPSVLQSVLVATCLVAAAAFAAPPPPRGSRGIPRGGDGRIFPQPRKERRVELGRRSHSSPPLTVFSEAPSPSQLFGYFLLDTTGFQPNVFTTTITGINDGVAPTA